MTHCAGFRQQIEELQQATLPLAGLIERYRATGGKSEVAELIASGALRATLDVW